MNDLRLLVVHASPDTSGATRLRDELEAEIGRRNLDPSDQPTVTLQAGFDNLPDPATFGALSLLVVYLPDPDGGFTVDEQINLTTFRKRAYPENRLVPVANAADRNRPSAPLEDLKSFPVHTANGIEKLATLLLNLLCLRLSGDLRRVFISYKTSDGITWADATLKGLKDRGYEVWRDDAEDDRDGLTMLTPGAPAQKTIREAILRQGFVLLIDTMESPLSGWVNEEVSTAIKYMLPILPVVVDDPIAPSDRRLVQVPKLGGRFSSVKELGREVRVGIPPPGQPQVLDTVFFDELERAMNETLLNHLRDRRRLIAEARESFQRRGFDWKAVQENRLLYQVTLPKDSDVTPELRVVILVQCAPYGTVLADTVKVACDCFREQEIPHQYVILVHRAPLYPVDKRRLVCGNGNHLFVLHTDEIDHLQSVFTMG